MILETIIISKMLVIVQLIEPAKLVFVLTSLWNFVCLSADGYDHTPLPIVMKLGKNVDTWFKGEAMYV